MSETASTCFVSERLLLNSREFCSDVCEPQKCQNPHEHSIDTELCSLGRLIYTMMTGEGREDEIYATYTGYFEREWVDRGQYSEQLETVVRFLLDRRHYLTRHAEVRIERVLPLTEVVMEYFREWQRVGGN
jgi:hypothetical protein